MGHGKDVGHDPAGLLSPPTLSGGTTQVSTHACSVGVTVAAASGSLVAAMHAAALAVRCCPWDPRFRLQLASCASSVSPEKAMAASRAAPLERIRVGKGADCYVQRICAFPFLDENHPGQSSVTED